jgi:hypothetical protein
MRCNAHRARAAISAALIVVGAACGKDLFAPPGRGIVGAPRFSSASSFAGANVVMDVQPATINLFSTLTINVVLYSTVTFDATSISLANTKLVVGGLLPGASVAARNGVPISSTRDYNGDTRLDRLITFNTADVVAAGLAGGAPALTLQDVTSASNQFAATDPTLPVFVGGADAVQNISGDVGIVANGTAKTLRVRLVNAAGAGVGNLRVRWDVVSGGGTFGAGGVSSTTVTDAGGYAQIGWTAGAGKGGQRVRASAPGLTNAPVTFVGITPEMNGSITVSPILETSAAASATIGPAGGTITATSANGTRYSLVIPPKAVLDATLITVTPIADIPNVPLGSAAVVGAQFAPDGLMMTLPARLDITTPAPFGTSVIAFGYSANGSKFYLAPATPATINKVSLNVTHFSGAGAAPSPGPLPASLAQIPVVDDEATAMQALAILTENARVAGQPLNITAVEGVFRSWYTAPTTGLRASLARLAIAGEDPFDRTKGTIDDALAEYASWLIGINQLGLDLSEESDAISLLTAAFQNAINVALNRCRTNQDVAMASIADRLAIQAEALGLTSLANGISPADVRARYCLAAEVTRPAVDPTFTPGQATIVPITPAMKFVTSTGSGPMPLSALSTQAAFASLSSAPTDVPFFVTITPQGTNNDVTTTSTTSPGGAVNLSVTPRAGVQEVTLTIRACIRAPGLPRLDDVCVDAVQTYRIGTGFAGKWLVIAGPNITSVVTSNLYISDDGPTPVFTTESTHHGLGNTAVTTIPATRANAHPGWSGADVVFGPAAGGIQSCVNGACSPVPSYFPFALRLIRVNGETLLEFSFGCGPSTFDPVLNVTETQCLSFGAIVYNARRQP